MSKKMRVFSGLPWFQFWTGNFKSKTDHLSNAEVGVYVRLLASYWDNNGLPFSERALTRIAKIEAEDDVDLAAILGEFFSVENGTLCHEELNALRVNAIGEEDANRRRTLSARLALAEQRRSATIPVAETEVDVEEDVEREQEPEPEGDLHTDSRPRNQTHTQTEDPDSQSDLDEDAEVWQVTTHRGHQSVSVKPDGGAQGEAVPAASSAHSGISFRLRDGSSIPLTAYSDESDLPDETLRTLKQLAARFESIPQTRVTAHELPNIMKQWLQPSRQAA